MVGKSTHLRVIPQQSTQNTANLPLQTYEYYIFLLIDGDITQNTLYEERYTDATHYIISAESLALVCNKQVVIIHYYDSYKRVTCTC